MDGYDLDDGWVFLSQKKRVNTLFFMFLWFFMVFFYQLGERTETWVRYTYTNKQIRT